MNEKPQELPVLAPIRGAGTLLRHQGATHVLFDALQVKQVARQA
jgi:hypothetical protein